MIIYSYCGTANYPPFRRDYRPIDTKKNIPNQWSCGLLKLDIDHSIYYLHPITNEPLTYPIPKGISGEEANRRYQQFFKNFVRKLKLENI